MTETIAKPKTVEDVAIEVHEWDGPTGVHFKDCKLPSGTYFTNTVPLELANAIELARENNDRVRIFYGDTETGRDWM